MSTSSSTPSLVHKDYEGGKLGMWLFLSPRPSFRRLFILYSATGRYRSISRRAAPERCDRDCQYPVQHQQPAVTAILSALQKGERRRSLRQLPR